MKRLLLALLLVLLPAIQAFGHALEPGFADIRQLTSQTWQVFWRKPDVAGQPMAIALQLPATCTPQTGPEPLFDGSAWISVWVADCPEGLADGTVSIEGLSGQRTDVLLRLQMQSGATDTIRLTPDHPSHLIPAQVGGWSVFGSYLAMGFEHILEGWDHLLFVFALLVLIRDFWRLVGAITAFTVAHSITLALAALGHLSVPGPPVEAIIALSIVFLAVEALKSNAGKIRLSERYPWLIAFAFGLLHGLGFAGALREIGLPEQDITTALLAFNLGVEAGQLAFVGVVLIAAMTLRFALPRVAAHWRTPGDFTATAISYGIGAVAIFWFVERVMSF
ncbi:HupE/UreJ family protein [Ruegeria arenilitoris]|uniref:HupE/UreJ family protein n=1 Tax=Ruegeria arenilitoris TaxID=1173585 RepID=UPI0020C29172|nr:HupE/UreJ family protein [Ruegeria arenilitoris]